MQRQHHQLRLTAGTARRRASRGIGLLDALIALALLGFGLLGMTKLQTNLVRAGSESAARLTAAQLGDELLSTALVDVDNAACYTLPASGTCNSDAAAERAEDWETPCRRRAAGRGGGHVHAGRRRSSPSASAGRARNPAKPAPWR